MELLAGGLEALFASHPDGMSLLELDDAGELILLRVNPALAARVGVRAEELVARGFRGMSTPERYEAWKRQLHAIAATGQAGEIEGGGLNRTDQVRVTIVPIGPGPTGRPRFVGQARDVGSQQKAEKALRDSEARLVKAQEIGQTGDFLLETDGSGGLWSPEMFRLHDWPGPIAPMPSEYFAMVHPDDVERLGVEWAAAMAGGPGKLTRYRVTTPAGALRWVEVTMIVERAADGQPRHMHGICRDVTELERAQAQARERTAELEALFRLSNDGVFMARIAPPLDWRGAPDRAAALDRALEDLHITDANDLMCSQAGVPREQLLGTRPRDFWTHAPATGRRILTSLFDHGRLRELQSVPRPDGTRLEIEGDLVCTYDDRGRIDGMFGVQRDVTERVRTMTALAESRERLELALRGGELYAWDFDLATQDSYIDPRLADHLGYSRAELVALARSRGMWHPDDLVTVVQAGIDCASGKLPFLAYEARVKAADGGYRWFAINGKVMARDPGGSATRLTGTLHDIDARKALEDRVQIAERMAALGTMAAGIGHEINNPLTFVLGNLGLVDDELARLAAAAPGAQLADRLAEARAMLAEARDGADRIRAIVQDLRTLTRSDDSAAAQVDLVKVVERCLQMADHQIRHRARLVRELEPLPRVAGQEGRLVQVVMNLLINAAQAIPEGAAAANRIRVATRRAHDGGAVVEVSDTGVGMSPEEVRRAFDAFFTTKEVGEGTGLGLSISRSIVTGLGGTIEIESAPGRGSTFRVRLPATVEPHPAASPVASLAGAPARGAAGLRILVIDDEPAIASVIATVLSDHDVVAMTDPRHALDALRAGARFDRIVCDLMMPNLTGMDFFDALGELDRSLQPRVVFLTGGAFTERARRFLDLIDNPLLEKPFDLERLEAILTAPPVS